LELREAEEVIVGIWKGREEGKELLEGSEGAIGEGLERNRRGMNTYDSTICGRSPGSRMPTSFDCQIKSILRRKQNLNQYNSRPSIKILERDRR
jgi:hypothetical protein